MIFYTYMWLRENGTPFYIGKGHGNRAWSKRRGNQRLKPPTRDRILIQQFPDEESAFLAEKILIAYYGRKDLGMGILCNRTDGGEGYTGPKPPNEGFLRYAKGPRTASHRAAISAASKGRCPAPHVMAAAHRARKNVPLSAAHKKALAEGNRNRIQSPEERLKRSKSITAWHKKRRAERLLKS
jgi:hypothetical protein